MGSALHIGQNEFLPNNGINLTGISLRSIPAGYPYVIFNSVLKGGIVMNEINEPGTRQTSTRIK